LIGVTTPSWALDVKWGGDYRLRGFYNDNLTDANKNIMDSAAYYSSRFLLTAAATEDNVSGVVTLIAGTGLPNGSGNRLLGATSYGPDQSYVDILEAYLKVDFKTWAFRGGRAVYKVGNGIILDDAVDGLWANINLGPAVVTLATLKIREQSDTSVVGIGNVNTTPNTGTGNDADLYVINAGLGKGMMGPAHNLNVFLAYLDDRSASLLPDALPLVAPDVAKTTDEANLWILGVSADADMGELSVKGEVDYLRGQQNVAALTPARSDLRGMNVVLGAKMKSVVPVGLDLVYTTGQKTSSSDTNVNGLNGNYPLGIIITNTGARSLDTKDGTCLSPNGMDINGISGSGSLGGSNGCYGGSGLTAVKLSSGLTHGPHVVDVAAIWARSTKDPDGSGVAKKGIGIELDATLTWAVTKRLSALGGIGYLRSGNFFDTNSNSKPDAKTVLVAQLSYTF
jgi:hypothetical protein